VLVDAALARSERADGLPAVVDELIDTTLDEEREPPRVVDLSPDQVELTRQLNEVFIYGITREGGS
jgi:hypothetical protein